MKALPAPVTFVFVFVMFWTLAPSASQQDNSVFAPNVRPQQLLKKGAGEGPAWHPELGLLTSGHGHINRRDREGKQHVFREDAGTNGLLYDNEGHLIACEPKRRRVTRTDRDGKVTVLTDRFAGKLYNQPNDLTIDSKGRVYFSDPCYGTRRYLQQRDAKGREIEGVYRIDQDGTVTRIITHEVDRPNGVLVSLDDRYLFVADNNNNEVGGARKLWRFDLLSDGRVLHASRKLLHDWGSARGPDGLVQDTAGLLYVAGGRNQARLPEETADHKGGVYVIKPDDGELIAFVPIPDDEVTNCTFGRDDLRTLFITAGGKLWSIRTLNRGWLPWPKPQSEIR